MKKITLQIIQRPGTQHWKADYNKISLFLHWGLTVRFTNIKEAEAFQNRLQYWLNQKFLVLQDEFISAWTMYRRLWIFYDTEMQDAREIELMLSQIDKNLKQVYELSFNPGSGALNYFNRLNIIINWLKQIYHLMEIKQKSRNNWEALKVISTRVEYLKYLEIEIELWPKPVAPE